MTAQVSSSQDSFHKIEPGTHFLALINERITNQHSQCLFNSLNVISLGRKSSTINVNRILNKSSGLLTQIGACTCCAYKTCLSSPSGDEVALDIAQGSWASRFEFSSIIRM